MSNRMPREKSRRMDATMSKPNGAIAGPSAEPQNAGPKTAPSARPVFLLALPRCHSAVVAAMLGQHPQMYDFPETHLFSAPTMEKWWELSEQSAFHMADGLLRAVAQLFFEEQTEKSVRAAEGWLRRRNHYTTSLVFESLAEKLGVRVPVEGSSSLVSRPAALQRMLSMFPLARFIYVLRHPRGFGEFLMKGIEAAARQGPVPYWMLNLASFPGAAASEDGTPHRDPGFDPQRAWYVLNANACEFLKLVPADQTMLLHTEDLFRERRPTLERIASWLGLRTDEEAIEAMEHPERSLYACLGPPNARYGNERAFLENPMSLPAPSEDTLEGPLSWRPGGQEFLPKVQELARQLGYR
jgi:hypothetical protein